LFLCRPDLIPPLVFGLQMVVNEMFAVARATSSALAVLPVKGAPENLAVSRAALFWAAQSTLKHGLNLLGLPALTRV
jgi:arginyl-tRNA synthetase